VVFQARIGKNEAIPFPYRYLMKGNKETSIPTFISLKNHQ
jgi:hypothetical protein